MNRIFSFLFFSLVCYQIQAQFPINIQTIVTPPYSPYLSDFINKPNKLMLVVTNTSASPISLRFSVSFIGDNGISLTTDPGFNPKSPIAIMPGQSRTFNSQSSEMREYFTTKGFTIIGIDKNELIQNDALPEGNYEICVRAFDFVSGAPISDASPFGCTQVPINYIDPPIIVLPLCGENLNSLVPQNIIFSWVPPATCPGGIDYVFTLKEIPIPQDRAGTWANNLNPNDVIKMGAYPVLFNSTLRTNTLVYHAGYPKLYEGHSYVWRVQARASNNSVSFKQNGFTEACVFNYQKSVNPFLDSTQSIRTPAVKDTLKNLRPTNLQGEVRGNAISLTWKSYGAKVQVMRKLEGEEYKTIAEMSNVEFYSDQNVERNKIYYYKIINSIAGNVLSSNEVKVKF